MKFIDIHIFKLAFLLPYKTGCFSTAVQPTPNICCCQKENLHRSANQIPVHKYVPRSTAVLEGILTKDKSAL